MKKIAVVTAFNKGNAGMYTVDIAAEQFLEPLGFEPVYFRAHTLNRDSTERFGRQTFRLVNDIEDLKDYGTVLYWGDFINSPMYGFKNFPRLEARFADRPDTDAAIAKWQRLFLGRGRTRSDQRLISVSNSFQSSDTVADQLDDKTRDALRSLYAESFAAIFPRDPESTASLSRAFGSVANGHCQTGVDAAFLADTSVLTRPTSKLVRHRYFGYYFGRSKLGATNQLLRKIAFATGLVPLNIGPWLSVDPKRASTQVSSMLSRINGSAFVVTDTYHCCVNTMNLGIPVIGVGRRESSQTRATSDHKKEVLFRMFGLSKCYFDVEGNYVDSATAQRINEQVIHLTRRSSQVETYANLVDQVERYRRVLTELLLENR